jgi:hypothetical protein
MELVAGDLPLQLPGIPIRIEDTYPQQIVENGRERLALRIIVITGWAGQSTSGSIALGTYATFASAPTHPSALASYLNYRWWSVGQCIRFEGKFATPHPPFLFLF